MLKNHKPFFINIGNYGEILVQNRQLFAHFRSVKFGSRDRASTNLVHKGFISTHIVYKFQLCTSSGFWVISKLIDFKTTNRRFLCFFECLFTTTWRRISKIGTHDAFIASYVEAKFQVCRFNLLLVISKSILICQNSRTKTKVLCAHAKSQLRGSFSK